jgi:hypothetical protein
VKPVHFDHIDQIKKSRPAFDETCLITTQNFADLVGDYSFSEDAHCQVERKDSKGTLCGHEHRKGWVGRRKDGKEGLVGSSCGPTYFKDHADFEHHRAFVTRELDLDEIISRLEVFAHDSAFLSRLDGCTEQLRSLRERSKQLVDSLPADVHERLKTMAKAGTASVNFEVNFPTKVEDKRTGEIRTKSSWVSQSISSVAGLATVDRARLISLGTELKAVRATFDSLDTRRDTGIRKLKAQVRTLDSLTMLESTVADLEAQFTAFEGPGNLANFWLLSRRQGSQFECLRVWATAMGLPNQSNNRLRAMLAEAEGKLRDANGGREVRPALF